MEQASSAQKIRDGKKIGHRKDFRAERPHGTGARTKKLRSLFLGAADRAGQPHADFFPTKTQFPASKIR
jgi:hypothetical protein